MSAWTRVPLAEIAEVFNGKTPSKAEQRNHGHPVLKIKDVSDVGEFRGSFDSFVDPDLAHAYQAKRLRAGDTLILNAAHNADYVGSKTYRVQPPVIGALATGEWLVIRPAKAHLDPDFAFHWVNSTEAHRAIRDLVKGIHLYPKDVARLRIPLPPLPEQRRIAEILDKADALRTKRRDALAQFDMLTQSIFLEMFGDPVINPRGFPIAFMGEVCDVRDGTHDSPKYAPDGRFPLITSKNVTGGSIDLSDVNYISEADYVQINKRSKVDRGDIILPMIGTIGSPVLVDHEPRYAIKNVALIKFITGSPLAVFVLHLLSSHYFDHVVTGKNRGGTQKFVSLGDLRAFPLPLPPEREQAEFARRMEVCFKIRRTHRASEIRHSELIGILQQRAFQGEL